MTSGTTNVVRIYGSTYGDYGVQPDGATHDWREKAACVSLDDELFYKKLTTAETEDLRAECAACPVLEQCRAAMEAEEVSVFDIWGFRAGKTEQERRAEMRGEPAPEPRKYVGDDDPEIAARFAAGASVYEVMDAMGLSEGAVRRARKRMGIKGDGRGGARGRSPIVREVV